MTETHSIPVRYDATAVVRGVPRRVRRTELVEVEIASHDGPDAVMEITSLRHRRVAITGGRAFLPVDHLRNPGDQAGSPVSRDDLPILCDLAMASPLVALGPHPPFSANDLGKWTGLDGRTKDRFAGGKDIEIVETHGREEALLVARMDAADLAFVDGHLHTARFELHPTTLAPRLPTHPWSWQFVDRRPDLSVVDASSFLRVRADRAEEVAGILGLPRPSDQLTDDERTLLASTSREGFRDFDVALVQLIRRRLSAIFPHQGTDSLTGDDPLLSTPGILDRHALAGRRLLRRLVPILTVDGDADETVEDAMTWLDEGSSLVAELGRKVDPDTRHHATFDPGFLAGLRTWRREIDLPLRRRNVPAISQEDADALEGMRP